MIRNPNCTLCPLHERSNHVCLMGRGAIPSDIVLVGEAPGKTEEFTREPFSGKAGELLDSILDAMHLNREELYITNAVKCRPQKKNSDENTKPSNKHIDICSSNYLTKELQQCKPKLIIAMGNSSLRALVGSESTISNARNIVHRTKEGYPSCNVVATFHPAAALYNDNLVGEIIRDFTYALSVLKGGVTEDQPLDYRFCPTLFPGSIMGSDCIALDLETDGLDSFNTKRKEIFSVQMCATESKARFALWENSAIRAQVKQVLENKNVEIVNHFLKFDLKWLRRYGIRVKGPIFSTEVALHLLDENFPHKGLDAVAAAFTRLKGHKGTLEGYRKKHKVSHRQVPAKVLVPYGCGDADAALRLRNVFKPKLVKKGVWPLFNLISMPTMKLLVDMEVAGCKIDTKLLPKMKEEYIQKKRAAKKEIYEKSGKVLIFGNKDISPKKLNRLLYDKWGLPALGKPKNWRDPLVANTAESTLNKLLKSVEVTREQKAFLRSILEYRGLSKLFSTYIVGIKNALRAGDTIHADFKLTGTDTGRLSCSQPNIQNIPRESDIKRLFVSRYGRRGCIMQIDLSQAELRWAAHLSQEPRMLANFRSGTTDFHTSTAAGLLKVSAEQVTPEQRVQAKTVNFGIAYGMGAYKLFEERDKRTGKRIFLSVDAARRFLAAWHRQFNRWKPYVREQEKFCIENGYVVSPFGRRRNLTILDPSSKQAKHALRQAINAPIQGGVSDYNLYCGLLARRAIKKAKLKNVVFINEVHDSWVLDTVEENLSAVYDIFNECFRNPDLSPFGFEMTCPMEVEIKHGPSWGELEEYAG